MSETDSSMSEIAAMITIIRCSENYGLWSRSMRIALLGRKKLGFVTSSCSRSAYEGELLAQWETCNAIALSWIMNNVAPEILGGVVKTDRDRVHLPTGEQADITHIGRAALLDKRKIKDVLYVPNFKFNLLSVAKLTKELKCERIGKERGGLYVLRGLANIIKALNAIGKAIKDSCEIRHNRLGHPSSSLKSEAVVEIKQFITMVQNQYGIVIKMIRSDNGSEFFNAQCSELLTGLGIIHQSSRPYTPQQNGIVERRHIYILDTARALKFQGAIPIRYWEMCVKTAEVPQNVEEMDIVYAGTQSNGHQEGAEAPNSRQEDAGDKNLKHDRKSTRQVKEPIWMKDYVTTKKTTGCTYPISNYLTYDHTSTSYQCYLAKFSQLTEPQTFKEAVKDNRWIKAMKQEVKALEDNNTWEIVKVTRSQREGLDYHDTFSPVAKMVIVRSLISLAASRGWNLFQMDVYNAFLQGYLNEEVYMEFLEDDLLITGSSSVLIKKAKDILHQSFKVKDLGELKYFLGIEVMRSRNGVLLNKRKYILGLISKMGLSAAKPASTPFEVNSKLTPMEYDQTNGVTGDPPLHYN
ncbi:PREDICTED: uncharacterized protein LOC109208047 [Nicotiana attenuata]|uniref:uncharacterized protein LOC109208047 n=1 Tax=Nicotiana attenuata TaxID=49451 RepID=UPI0009054B51|nr:PREDICTED: uncharacterized protein LOC109208047 [Nicotiana attenuata]